jgi:transposase
MRPSGECQQVGNDERGTRYAVSRLYKVCPALVMLEATGGLEQSVAAALAWAGLPVAVVNPRQVRDFAKAVGKLAKTDTLDAKVLAHFAEAVQPELRPLPDEQAQLLSATLLRRREPAVHRSQADYKEDGGAPPLVEAGTGTHQRRARADCLRESDLAGENCPAKKRGWCRAYALGNLARQITGTGAPESQEACCPRWSRASEPGFGHPTRYTHQMGWALRL